MKKFFLLTICLIGLAVGVNAQGGGNSKAARSINTLRQAGCGDNFFQGNNWNIYASLEATVRCPVSETITGLGDVYIVVASYNCTSEICPAIADFIIGRVFFCGNDIYNYECY